MRFQSIAVAVVIISAVCLASICFRWAYADILDTQVKYHLDAAYANPDKRTPRHWQQAQTYLTKVLDIRPQHPQYLETAERYYKFLAVQKMELQGATQVLGWRENEAMAMEYAVAGLQLMPSWPYLWKQLAISKITLGQFDGVLVGAYRQANRLGPWEGLSQFELAAWGVGRWGRLNLKLKHEVLFSIEHVLNMPRVKRYHSEKLLAHPNILQVCLFGMSLKENVIPKVWDYCRNRIVITDATQASSVLGLPDKL